MTPAAKASTEYLEELSILLRNQGFTVYPRDSRDIDVEYDRSDERRVGKECRL